MAKIITNPPEAARPIPNLRGEYLRSNSTSLNPEQSFSMLAATGAVTAAQSAAFVLLNRPKPNTTNNDQFKRKLQDPDSYQPDQPDGYSTLGTPIYGRIILGLPGQENKWTDAQNKKGSYTTVELDCAFVDIEFNNKVVKTDIQGLPQTIKEFMSGGDDDITITGRFDNTPGVAPIEFIRNLNKIFKAPVPIPVTNYYLNANNIFYIVIMPGTTMGQSEAGYSSQVFTIKAISDVPMTQMLP